MDPASQEPGNQAASVRRALTSGLKDAAPARAKDPRSAVRAEFERKTKRYFVQLTRGCGDSGCGHRLCASSAGGPRLAPDAAAVMAVQLAARPRTLFCPRMPEDLPNVAMPETFSFSPFATPRISPTNSPAHSRSNSIASGASIASAAFDSSGLSGQLDSSGIENQSGQLGTSSVLEPSQTLEPSGQTGGSGHHSRSSSAAISTTRTRSASSSMSIGSRSFGIGIGAAPRRPSDSESVHHLQQPTSNPHAESPRSFMFSILSTPPFAALFQAATPIAAPQIHINSHVGQSSAAHTTSAERGFDSALRAPNTHLHRASSDGTLRVHRRSASSSIPQPSPLSNIASHRVTQDIPDTADPAPTSSNSHSRESYANPDSPPLPCDELAASAAPSAPSASDRSRSLLDLPSLLSATMNLRQSVLRGRQSSNTSSSSIDILSTHSRQASSNGSVPASYHNCTQSGPDNPTTTIPSDDCNNDTAENALEQQDTPEDHSQFGLEYLTYSLLELAIETYTSTLRHAKSLESSPEHAMTAGASETDKLHQKTEPIAYGVVGDPSFLVNTLRTVFSSVDALSRSFLVTEKVLPKLSGLDVPSLRKSYHLILQLSPSTLFQSALVDALELLLAKLLMDVTRLHHAGPDLLRIILIMMENPLLLDPMYHESLLKKLCLVLGSLRTNPRVTLIRWLSQYDRAGLENIITVFQKYVIDHVHSVPAKPDSAFIGTIKVLSMLSHANETHTPPITPHTTFYMPALAQKINFKEEYRTWRHSLDSRRVTEFSFFNYPFLFDPIAKTRIMHIDARVQMSHLFEDAYINQAIVQHAQRILPDMPSTASLEQDMKHVMNPFLVLEVRRSRLVDDVLDQITRKEADLKRPLKVRFVGGGEEGQDQGGVQKEFFQILVNRLLDPAYGMFVYDEETRSSWINGASLESERQFELVGIILGLALYNGVMLGVNLPLLLYKKLLDMDPTFDDFKLAFPTLGRGLQQLLDWPDGDVSDVFMRSFEISYDVYGQVKTYPLVANGDSIPVTNKNRDKYVQLYTQHYMDRSIRRPFRAFRSGFHKVVGGDALKMCRPDELELMICGGNTTELDFMELQRATEYDDGYGSDHPTIVWFWDTVHAMTLDQKRKLLNFVTASDRMPLKGLGDLTFVIQRNGPDTDRLPTALTCFGRLLLPEYSHKDKLANRLTTAIENAKGFGLV